MPEPNHNYVAIMGRLRSSVVIAFRDDGKATAVAMMQLLF